MGSAAQQVIWRESEREVFTKRRRPKPSEWADRYIRLDDSSPVPGKFRSSRLAYSREPMDALVDPRVETLVLEASAQSSKTTIMLVALGYIIDQMPGPTMWATGMEDDVRDEVLPRLRAWIESTPKLLSHTITDGQALRGYRWQLDRMFIKFAWGGSPRRMASTPIKYYIADELDKWTEFSGKESDPDALGDARTSNYRPRKLLKASTPVLEGGRIHKAYLGSDQRRFYVPCPECGVFQVLRFPNMKWEGGEEANPEAIKRENAAWFECTECGDRIYQKSQMRMNAAGVWVPEGATVDKRGTVRGVVSETSIRGYHFWKAYNPMNQWGEIAAQRIRVQGDRARLMEFVNQWLGEPWVETVTSPQVRSLSPLERPYAIGAVPDSCFALTCGIDCQAVGNRFYYGVRAWAHRELSYLIDYGTLMSWDEVLELALTREFPRGDGRPPMKIRLSCIDSSWNTDEVYSKCRADPTRLIPIKGDKRMPSGRFRITAIDKEIRGGKGARITGLQLYGLDVNAYKDKLAWLISPAKQQLELDEMEEGEDAGVDLRWFLPHGVSDEYRRQLTAEHAVMDRRGTRFEKVWKLKPGRRANHFLDVEIYNLAAADILGVGRIQSSEAGAALLPAMRRTTSQEQTVTSGSDWIDTSEDWLT